EPVADSEADGAVLVAEPEIEPESVAVPEPDVEAVSVAEPEAEADVVTEATAQDLAESALFAVPAASKPATSTTATSVAASKPATSKPATSKPATSVAAESTAAESTAAESTAESTAAEQRPGPFPGSVLPRADGSAPSGEFVVKGNASSKRSHGPSSPYYNRTRAEVWFRTEADAVAAGFRPWAPKAD
ncbi:MAG: hypothetical protein QOF99_4467, partial [Pseudonocardiales bacterium]|nr:hypothetical protein [Pseudonocardiales bacterium]